MSASRHHRQLAAAAASVALVLSASACGGSSGASDDPNAKTTFGIVKIKAHQRNPFHTHPNCEEILYVLSGSCEHRLGDRIDVLKAGDLIRIPAGVPHCARALDEPMESVVVYSTGRRQFVVVEEQGSP